MLKFCMTFCQVKSGLQLAPDGHQVINNITVKHGGKMQYDHRYVITLETLNKCSVQRNNRTFSVLPKS